MTQSSFVHTNRCSITIENGNLLLSTPFDRLLVENLKTAVPAHERKWDSIRRVWLVSPQYAKVLVLLVFQYFNEDLDVPNVMAIQAQPVTKLLNVRYIGQCKSRDDGSVSAFGYAEGTWSVIFPEETLRSWFKAGPATPNQSSTLYGILGIGQSATNEEIRTAFRRAARTCHPDLNHEPGATEQFKLINHAYQIISDPKTRTRYDTGLKFEASLPPSHTEYQEIESIYRSPLNCGWILCSGIDKIGRFVVEKILEWQDITNAAGKTLVTSYPMGAKEPIENWV